jgi:hypothetical protein
MARRLLARTASHAGGRIGRFRQFSGVLPVVPLCFFDHNVVAIAPHAAYSIRQITGVAAE